MVFEFSDFQRFYYFQSKSRAAKQAQIGNYPPLESMKKGNPFVSQIRLVPDPASNLPYLQFCAFETFSP